MHDVRLIYKKQGRTRYISHLDMNRLIPRVLRRSGLPVWYSQGFNPRVHITFALPLSLGYVSEYDIVDFRLTDDEISNDYVLDSLKKALPDGIEAVEIIEPMLKPKDVGFADFTIEVLCDEKNCSLLENELKKEQIIVSKTTKKGGTKQFDVCEFIKNRSIEKTNDGAKVCLTLTAGNDNNINPSIIFDAFMQNGCIFEIKSVVRGNIYDKNMRLFR